MNLLKLIGSGFSKAHCNQVVRYVGSDSSRFADLMQVLLNGPYRNTQRAAWPLSYIVQQSPELIKPWLGKLLRLTAREDAPVALKRNVVRLLQYVEIPKAQRGRVATLCFSMLTNHKETIAVRVFSMTVLANICQHHPELKAELRSIIEDELPYGSAGFRSRGAKLLKLL